MREDSPLVGISSTYKNTTRFALDDIKMNK
jgi:hypothetical protein